MKKLIAIIAILLLIPACSIFEPSSPTTLEIKVENAAFISPNKFLAKVSFDNKLGRQVNILNVGCMVEVGRFMPGFILEHFDSIKWLTVGGPGCTHVDAGFTSLAVGDHLTTTEEMYTDSLPAGMYRLRFDIRENDLHTNVQQSDLLSNTFSITY